MRALGETSQTKNQTPQSSTTSHEPVVITTQNVMTTVLNELTTTCQAHMALEQKFEALTMEYMNERGPKFIIKPFKGDKKERPRSSLTLELVGGNLIMSSILSLMLLR